MRGRILGEKIKCEKDRTACKGVKVCVVGKTVTNGEALV